jgi:hypothetical protein
MGKLNVKLKQKDKSAICVKNVLNVKLIGLKLRDAIMCNVKFVDIIFVTNVVGKRVEVILVNVMKPKLYINNKIDFECNYVFLIQFSYE